MTRPGFYKLFAVCVFGFFLYSFFTNWHLISQNTNWDSSPRTQYILDSAKCSQQTGMILTMCSDKQSPVGVESYSVADDRGHNLLANVVSLFKTEPLTTTTITLSGLLINAIGLLALSFCFFVARMPVAAVLSLYFGTSHGIPGPFAGAESAASYFGVFCLAAAPVILFVARVNRRSSMIRDLLVLMFAVVCLGSAILFRQSIGMGGIVASLVVLSFMFIAGKGVAEKIRLSVLSLCLIGLVGLPEGLLTLRGWAYQVPRGNMVGTHGFAHTLYAGLGSEPNPWGIQWDDTVVWKQIEKYNPKAKYGTESHFSTAKVMYFNILRTSPKIVAQIYWSKLKIITTGLRLQHGTLATWLIFTALILLVGSAFSLGEKSILIMTLGLYVETFLIILQGVLATYDDKYIYPARFAVVLLLLCVLEWVRRFEFGLKFGSLFKWRPT